MIGRVKEERLTRSMLKLLGTFSFIYFYISFIYLGKGVCRYHCALVEARTTRRSLFSPPTLWELGVELRLSVLLASTFTH